MEDKGVDAYKEKSPGGKLDYTVEWVDWLDGDTIATSTWLVDTGITSSDEFNDTVDARIWLDGGTKGSGYNAKNHIITAAGREEEFTLRIVIV